jgi:hypothetical protein
VKDSIALAFVDKGAAAYLGYVNSPHTTAFMRRGLSVPGPTSWQGFPLGIIAQVQNKVANRVIFTTPQFFMLGDPRIYLSQDKPYRIVSETLSAGGRRVVQGESSVEGVLAVKIDGAARYHYLKITGVTSVSEGDLFYNSKAQTLNLGADKYILFAHQGGDFQIELSTNAPLAWPLADALVDVMDNSWVVLWLDSYSDSNPQIHVLSLIIFIGIVLFKLLKRRKPISAYRDILVIALVIALLRLAYFMLRLDSFTVSANVVTYSAQDILTGFLGVFASVAGGLMVMKDGKGIRIKTLGLVFSVLRQFFLVGFTFAFVTLLNNVTPMSKMTAPGLLNYNTAWLASIALLIEAAIVIVAYRYVISRRKTTAQR